MNKKIHTIIILALLLTLQPAYAQYLGGDGRGDIKLVKASTKLGNNFVVDGNWSTTSCWTTGTLPGTTETVHVMANATVDGNVTVHSIAIYAGNSLTIPSGKTLTVNGALTNEAGNSGLVIESGGSLITNGTVTGLATLHHTISDGNFHLLALPVNTTITAAPTFLGYYVDEYLEGSGAWNRLTETDLLNPMKGYSVKYFSGTGELSFEGELFTGDQLFSSLTYNSGKAYDAGWNLIGNPYPSAIDLDAASFAATNLNGWVYVWNGTNYVAGIIAGGAGTLQDNIIPSMQGFFVRATATGASLTLPNAARVHSSQAFYKKEKTFDNVLMLTVAGNNTEDKMMFAINQQATDGFDQQWDAYKLFGNADAPQLYTTAGDQLATVSAVPAISEESELPLLLKVGAETTYTLTAQYTETFITGMSVILNDLLTGQKQNLNDNPVYTFTAAPGQSVNRFKLTFGPVSVAEVSASNIGIFAVGQQIHLQLPEFTTGNVAVIAIDGRVTISRPFSAAGTYTLNTSLPAGIYVVQVSSEPGIVNKKVIINHK